VDTEPEPNALARSSPLAMEKWRECAARLASAGAAGEDPAAARDLVHEVHLPSPEAADLFVEVAGIRGFACAAAERADAPGEFRVEARRSDPVTLPHLHNVVMELVELAAPYDGDHVRVR